MEYRDTECQFHFELVGASHQVVGFGVAAGVRRWGAGGVLRGVRTRLLIGDGTPMALSGSAAAELWEAFRAGGGAGLVRGAVGLVLQGLVEAGAVGAGRYGRGDSRSAGRSGGSVRFSVYAAVMVFIECGRRSCRRSGRSACSVWPSSRWSCRC